MNRKLVTILLFLFTFNQLRSDSIYIDLQYRGIGNGTINQPYSSWNSIIWKDGNTYFFKRGNILIVNYKLRPSANHIIIGAYGTGSRPVFRSSVDSTENVLDLGGLKNVIVQDIEIESNNKAATCLQFFKSQGGTLKNCKIIGGIWGVRNVLSTGNFKITDCEISQTADDGIFIKDIDSIEISGSYIHHVNLNYLINSSEKFSGGDCIQLVNVKKFYIHDNKLDHSGTGNKFCFISSSTVPGLIPTGIIENNIITRDSLDSGDLIYLTGSEHVIIRHNIFQNGNVGIYNYSKNPKIYYNVFTNQKIASIYAFADATSITRVFNNTFVKVNSVILLLNEKGELKNNIIYKTKEKIYPGGTIPVSDYNCFYPGGNLGTAMNIGSNSMIKDPMFIYEDTGNFRLREGSPCIAKGIALEDETISYPFVDLAKLPVSKNTITMGALEYYPADTGLFKIYPNPNDGIFILSFLEIFQESAKITISDLQGNPMYSAEIPEHKNFMQFDLKNFKSGTYKISVTYKNQPVQKRFVIQQ